MQRHCRRDPHPGRRSLLAVENPPPPDLDELQNLYRARDFFLLAERLEEISGAAAESPEIRFLMAATQQAFNQPDESNRTIDSLLEEEALAQAHVSRSSSSSR